MRDSLDVLITTDNPLVVDNIVGGLYGTETVGIPAQTKS